MLCAEISDWQCIERRTRQCSQLTRNACNRQAIGTIGRELERNQVIIKVEKTADIHTDCRIRWQGQQPPLIVRQA